jgi:hypothetical protein
LTLARRSNWNWRVRRMPARSPKSDSASATGGQCEYPE